MHAEQELFTIRAAGEKDRPALELLLHLHGMAIPEDLTQGTVAVNANDEVVGFIRIQRTARGPHVAPVAVFPSWQGFGVGRALMLHEAERFGMLKLASRGDMAGFYRAIGCREISFEEISDELEEDCHACPDRATCKPLAFALDAHKKYEAE